MKNEYETLNIGEDIVIHLGYDNSKCEIESYIERESCCHCGIPDCCYRCDMSIANMQNPVSKLHGDPENEVAQRLMFNGALDGIESLILSCAVAGIDVESVAFQEALETSLESIGNNFS